MVSKQQFIAANRFGFGETPSKLNKLYRAKDWLYNQVKPELVQESLRHFSGLPSTAEAADALAGVRNSSQEQKQAFQKESGQAFRSELSKRLELAITSETPLIERLTLFWSNHFTVSVKGKPPLLRLAGPYEREAIRAHIFGKFEDMLIAVARHLAMLMYLDNHTSIGPNSKAGQRRGKGLNENLAREILELHTLGVNGGYTQDDVIGLARMITGWTIKPPQIPGKAGYMYIDRVHEPGTHRLLGQDYAENGEQQGLQALKDLARHPLTAKFIATKLARHFIADDPPKFAVHKLETAYTKTGGDLRALTLALIDLSEVWSDTQPKLKTPYEFIVSTLRVLGAEKNMFDSKSLNKLLATLRLLEHMPFNALSPAGFPDKAEDWLSANALMNRIEWSHAFAQQIGFRENPTQLAKEIFPPLEGKDTIYWISRAPGSEEGLAVLLSSPQFQKR